MPPRHGKSFIISERFPIWHLGRDPRQQIVLTSYGQTLSDKFSRRARSLAESDFARDTFPNLRIDRDRRGVEEWETTAGGGYRAVGIGGGITGAGADILIIDDPIKDAKEANSRAKRDADYEWYQTTGYTRLMPGAGVLLVMTRWNDDDLPGRLERAAAKGEGDVFDVISFPAIAERDEPQRAAGEALHPERYNARQLQRIKKAVGPRTWSAMFQQNPTAAEGIMFKRDWFRRRYKEPPKRFERLIVSWDCAFMGEQDSDYVAGQVWGKIGSDFYLLDASRDQADFVATCAMVRALADTHPTARPILVENKANGPAVISHLKTIVSGLVSSNPQGSKESRASAVTPHAESGNIILPEEAPWLDDFLDEICRFPRAANDDQVDAMSQAILHLIEPGASPVFPGALLIFDATYEAPFLRMGDRAAVHVGVRWDETGEQAFVALDSDGRVCAVETMRETVPALVVSALDRFCRDLARSPVFVHFDAGGMLERLIGSDGGAWERATAESMAEADVGELVSRLKDDLEDASVSLEPVEVLLDQMSRFMVRLDGSTPIYEAPKGLSSACVLALAMAAKSLRENLGTMEAIVIPAFDPFGDD